MTQTVVSDRTAKLALTVDRFAFDLAQHWLLYVNGLLGIFVLAPFAAPALMAIGATAPADAIYFFYSLLCHQLPQRSLFLFGHKASYSLAELSRAWQYENFLTLRAFIGNEAMGWKVAWSDRMMSFYGSIWIGAILFALLRKRIKPLSPIAWFFIGVLPVGIDGVSHMINDALAGTTGLGFRDTNAWLQFITGNILPTWFYAGDAFGSFNSDLRWITGFLFALATVWFIFPIIQAGMRDVQLNAARQLRRAAEKRAAEHVLHMMQAEDAQSGQGLFLEGWHFLINQPEFSHGSHLVNLINLAEQKKLAELMIPENPAEHGVRVIIGHENKDEAVQGCSLVISRYGLPDEPLGSIAVVGPTRMEYERTIAVISYVSSLIILLVTELYGVAPKKRGHPLQN